MNKMLIKMKQTFELTEDEFTDLITLKQQHWDYSVNEQKRWFANNIEQDDYHLMIYQNGTLVAYLNAVNINVDINQSPYRMLGIGNVCVDKRHAHLGIGSILVACINSYIKRVGTVGLLLCKENLIRFYETSNWTRIFPAAVRISNHLYCHEVMIFDPDKTIGQVGVCLEIPRNF